MTRRVVVLPADESACGWYRMRLPAGAVRGVRPDWTIEVYRPSDVALAVDANGDLLGINGVPAPDEADLVIMQRTGTKAQVQFLDWLGKRGVATIMDSDDAMWAIDPQNAAYKAWNGHKHNWVQLDQAAGVVDLTTVTTPALARRYGRHGRTEVLPNCVPGDLATHLTSVRDQLDPTVTIGWAGFTSTHPGDLTVCGTAVRDIQRETGCTVRVVGDPGGAARDWNLDHVDPVSPAKLGLPYYTALTTMDVGLVPLRDTPFNRAKSYLKALEFSAVGVPVVASPTPANQELAKTVPMVLASSPQEWHDALLELVNKPDLRAEMGAKAQQAALRQHTYESQAEAWARTWERAMLRRSKMKN